MGSHTVSGVAAPIQEQDTPSSLHRHDRQPSFDCSTQNNVLYGTVGLPLWKKCARL